VQRRVSDRQNTLILVHDFVQVRRS
jgi:hypothetical protein